MQWWSGAQRRGQEEPGNVPERTPSSIKVEDNKESAIAKHARTIEATSPLWGIMFQTMLRTIYYIVPIVECIFSVAQRVCSAPLCWLICVR